jgi:hypothetical protein
MKVISIWQPFASLVVHGCKVFETRGWPAPQSLIGRELGIAATKSINPAQRAHCAQESFQLSYAATALPEWETLPRGALLGHVTLCAVEEIDEELLENVSVHEQAFGWWEPGGYAWRLTNPVIYPEPVPIRGRQGIFDWNGNPYHVGSSEDEAGRQGAGPGRPDEPETLRRHLRAV